MQNYVFLIIIFIVIYYLFFYDNYAQNQNYENLEININEQEVPYDYYNYLYDPIYWWNPYYWWPYYGSSSYGLSHGLSNSSYNYHGRRHNSGYYGGRHRGNRR